MDLFPIEETNLKIKRLQGWVSKNSIYICCLDIYRELENKSSKQHIRNTCKKMDFTEKKYINCDFTPDWTILNKEKSAKQFYMIQKKDLKDFIFKVLKRARKTKSQKLNLFEKFGIPLSEEEIEELRVPIECSVLEIFTKACPFEVVLQYRMGKYRLDAYIPRLRLAIQIDENNHSNYCENEERQYNTAMRDNHIVCIRFTPDEDDPDSSGLELLKIVWNRTLSPDFYQFKQKY
jgi:very-short-patch-repair endonuclease